MLSRRSALQSSAAALVLSTVPAAAVPGKADATLNALFDQFMKENLDNSPMTVTALGLDKAARAVQKRQLDDTSLAGIAHAKAITYSQRDRLKAFDRASLSPGDSVSYDVIAYGLEGNGAADKRFN